MTIVKRAKPIVLRNVEKTTSKNGITFEAGSILTDEVIFSSVDFFAEPMVPPGPGDNRGQIPRKENLHVF